MCTGAAIHETGGARMGETPEISISSIATTKFGTRLTSSSPLTPFGQTLADALKPLCAWGAQHLLAVEQLVSRREALGLKRIA